jgi:hypothetical protein
MGSKYAGDSLSSKLDPMDAVTLMKLLLGNSKGATFDILEETDKQKELRDKGEGPLIDKWFIMASIFVYKSCKRI